MEMMSFHTKVNNPIALLAHKAIALWVRFFNKYLSSKILKTANYNYF